MESVYLRENERLRLQLPRPPGIIVKKRGLGIKEIIKVNNFSV